MKIIIPMSGIGKRFVEAGYIVPKPLIRVDGKPIIEYVVSMFPGDHEFIFICNKEHLNQTEMRKVLNEIKPNSLIVGIEPHKKGPVYAVSKVFDHIKDDEDVMVSYCDYYMEWDFYDFIDKINSNDFDGAIPSYIGFHPHLLHSKYYAGVLADENKVMTDIKEKHCFSENLMDCYQSAGAYYFRKGKKLKRYFKELMDLDINLNNEYYVSMVYYLYLRDGLKVYIPDVKRMMQWGTPEDLEEFEAWSRFFHTRHERMKKNTDIPKSRECNVAIPHSVTSDEYRKSHDYWSGFFIK